MSYKVLYRKYRPQTFSDIIDQRFITDTLKESIINNKISHAYIFSGPKGTGKTSTAKVFAKAINCEKPENGEPCGKCNSCLNFNLNPDIIELDAASNNKVEDIREIINNVKLAPSTSKYKIYIIDEVHMLTNSASNAFLLTLEEPPSHAIFILATTNPESLPQTILSRCQHFAFSKISKKALIDRIKYVLNQEKINIADDIITEIANLADGGLRDALSILDQLITLNKPITIDLLTEQFGVISDKSLDDLLEAIYSQNIIRINELFDSYKEYGISEKSFVYKFISLLSNKICDLKVNNDEIGVSILKNILNEVLKIDTTRTSFNYYDVVKMIIITNLNVSGDIDISREIISDTKVDEKTEEKVISEPDKEIRIENSGDNVTLIKENKNLPKVNNNDELISIRINNSFVNATKKEKNDFEKEYNNYIELLKNDNELYSLMLDTSVGAVSPTNAILVCESDASANLLNERLNVIQETGKFNNKKIVFISSKKWDDEINIYKKNLKEKKIYEYIKEPEIIEEDDIINLADGIFGNENIVVEE